MLFVVRTRSGRLDWYLGIQSHRFRGTNWWFPLGFALCRLKAVSQASPFLVSAGLVVFSFPTWGQTNLVHVTACSFKTTDCTISPTSSGNLIVIGQVSESAKSKPISSATDNAGNIYRRASGGDSVTLPNGSVFDIWYTANGLPGATSLLITGNSGGPKENAMVWEFTGVGHTASADEFRAKDWVRLIASAFSEEWTQSGVHGGKTVSSKAASLAIGPVNACDINQDGTIDVLDGQAAINMSCTAGICNGGFASQVINASLGRPCTHSVLLTWTPNTAANVAGYNIYRTGSPGGSYTKINLVLVSGASYRDATVEAGKTYYYVASTVDTSHAESSYSAAAFAAVPAQ